MSISLFAASEREPSQFVGFAGNRIERLSENRSDDSVEKALTEPTARIMLMRGGRIWLKLADSGVINNPEFITRQFIKQVNSHQK